MNTIKLPTLARAKALWMILVGSCIWSMHAQSDEQTEHFAKAIFPEYLEFLTLPNVAKESAPDIQKNAYWAVEAFKRHGFNSHTLPDGDTPMVFAELPGASPLRPTVLFYAHMDGQAVTPSKWDQESPWIPVLKEQSAQGTWQQIPMENLYAKSFNPDWRVFARSASDDKAPIMMLLAAADALQKQGVTPAINIKVILDSHEEGGPPTLKDVIRQNADILKADAVIMLDGPMHASNEPTMVYGHRGVTGMSITVFGPDGDKHSGHYGNFIANPADQLARLITSFKDDEGRVVIPGFYDGVEFNEVTKGAFASVPDNEDELVKGLGVAQYIKVGNSYQEAINYPSLNINGMGAGSIEVRRTIIPGTATANFDIRTTVATPGERQVALVKKFVVAQGYHLVDGQPTPQERQQYTKLASVTGGGGAKALQTPLDAPIGIWVNQALSHAYETPPVRIPIMGGTVPTSGIVDGLKVPVLLVPLVNNDNNQHAPNENFRVGNMLMGVKSLYALFTTPWPAE